MCDPYEDSLGRGARRAYRRLGLLAGAVLGSVALMCAAAVGASAEPIGIYLAGEESEEEASQPIFEAESYPLEINGAALSEYHTYTFNVGSYECPGMGFITPIGEEVSEASKTLRLEPVFFPWECSTNPPGYYTQFGRNGCVYELEALNVGPPYAGGWAVDCPSETGMQIFVKTSQVGVTICVIEVLPQTGLTGVSLENTGEGSGQKILANFEVSGIKYTQTPKIEKGCGESSGEFENGTYTGESELYGEA